MMRIFESGYKINFADTNDVFVGFDNSQGCCESFGHFFLSSIPDNPLTSKDYSSDNYENEIHPPVNLEELVFDKEFYQNQHGYDGGGFAIFRLVTPALRVQNDVTMRERARQRKADGYLDEAFLVLYNHHNGCYGHGFEVKHDGVIIRQGGL